MKNFWKKRKTDWFKDQVRTPVGEATKEDHLQEKEMPGREYFSPEVQRGITGVTPDSPFTESGYNFSHDYPLSTAFPRRHFDYPTTKSETGDY